MHISCGGCYEAAVRCQMSPSTTSLWCAAHTAHIETGLLHALPQVPELSTCLEALQQFAAGNVPHGLTLYGNLRKWSDVYDPYDIVIVPKSEASPWEHFIISHSGVTHVRCSRLVLVHSYLYCWWLTAGRRV
jgi:hypothetical protein